MSNHYFFLLFIFFLNTPSFARKLLHHPFFPLTSSQSPSQSPSTNFLKYPFSTNQNPFFPSITTSIPPPYHSLSSSSSLPTFPANISSLITPSSHSTTSKLLKAIIFPILSFLLLSLFLLFLFIWRKRRLENGNDCSDNDRLFPPNTASSDSRKATEFLYLGTLVSSRGEEGSCSAAPLAAAAAASSPELRPLPPLVRRSSSEEEFQSPCGSPETKRLDFYVPNLSSPSYPSSNVASSSSPSSSPAFCSSLEVKLPHLAVFRPSASISSPKIKLSSSPLKKVEAFERSNFVVLPPPPPQPLSAKKVNGFDGVERREEIVRPKLKPLHWDKVKASSDRAMVWDQMKSSSFQ